MKKILTMIAAAAIAVMMAALSGVTAYAGSSTSTGYNSGVTAGKALNTLYKQYKTDGKLDTKNATNLVQLALLGTSISGLKGQDKSSDYVKDFNKGLVLGSAGLVSTSTSSTISDTLSSLSNLDFSSFSSSSSSSSSSSGLLSGLLSGSSSSSSDDSSSDDSSTISSGISDILSLFSK